MDWGFGSPYAVTAPTRRVTPPHVTFPSISGLVFRTRADDLGLANGAAIASATDLSGSGHDAIQAVAASQPTYVANVLGGRGVMRFDGNDFLHVAFTLSQPVTALVVGKAGATGTQQFLDGGIAGSLTIYRAPGTFNLYAGAVVTGPVADSSFHTLLVVENGASSAIHEDGGAPTTGNSGPTNPGGVTIGAWADGTLNQLIGDVAEVAVFNKVLSTAEKNQIGVYIVAEYGLTWTTVP